MTGAGVGRIVVRVAPEIHLKARKARRRFEAALAENVADALVREGVEFRLEPGDGRMVVETGAEEAALRTLGRVFGIGSCSPIDRVMKGDMDAIREAAVELYAGRVEGRTYAVRAKRLGQRIFSSLDLEVAVGTALNRFGRVDLEHPEVTVRLEIADGVVSFHTLRAPGAGGLPAGTQGRVLTLVSGGYDSAVAAWMLMKRGAAVDFLLCNLGGKAYERMVLRVVKRLTDDWGAGTRPRFYVADFGTVLDDLRARVTANLWQVVLKRLMVRAGCRLARVIGAEALATGEALGQVSSQTLSNLNTIDGATDIPVLRPLIGFDKKDIIRLAREIGTAPLSEHVREYCAITPGQPAITSRRGRVAREEERLDPALLEAAVARATLTDLVRVGADDLADAYVVVDALPEGAIIIDCGPEPSPLLPGALHRPADALLDDFPALSKEQTYLLCCPHGTRSAMIAEVMQEAGYEAYALRGGTSSIDGKVPQSLTGPPPDSG